jgi:hypothetical protein
MVAELDDTLPYLSDCFIKFVIHEMNSKIIKSAMVMLTETKKNNMSVR